MFKTTLKRVLALTLAAVLAFGIMPLVTFAASTPETKTVTFTDALKSKGDVINHKFTLDSSAKVVLTFSHDYIDWGKRDMWKIQLLSQTGKVYEFGSDSDSSSVATIPMFLPAGSYTLRISAAYYLGIAFEHNYIGSPIIDYTVSAAYEINNDLYEKESNDTQSTATPIQGNVAYTGALQGNRMGELSGSISGGDRAAVPDVDWYSFDLATTGNVQVSFQHEFADWRNMDIFKVTLLSAEGDVLSFKSLADDIIKLSEKTKLEPGKYYVKVARGEYNKYPASYLPYNLTVTVEPIIAFADNDKPSSWALPAVETAIKSGLATAEITKKFQANTTRAEFCRAAVNFLRKYGFDVDSVTPKMFEDTSDKDISIAAALKITGGTNTAGTQFSPNRALTREEAATMLRNVMNVIGAKYDTTAVKWTDAKEMSSWAEEAVNVMYNAKIMGGTSTTALVFAPKSPYTHEASIVTFVNLWEYLKK